MGRTTKATKKKVNNVHFEMKQKSDESEVAKVPTPIIFDLFLEVFLVFFKL